jgi:hypothetical protein
MLADGSNHNGHRELEDSPLFRGHGWTGEEKKKKSPARFSLLLTLEGHAKRTSRQDRSTIPLAAQTEIHLCAGLMNYRILKRSPASYADFVR